MKHTTLFRIPSPVRRAIRQLESLATMPAGESIRGSLVRPFRMKLAVLIAAIAGIVAVNAIVAPPALADNYQRTYYASGYLNYQQATHKAKELAGLALGTGSSCAASHLIGALGRVQNKIAVFAINQFIGGDDACTVATRIALIAADLYRHRYSNPYFAMWVARHDRGWGRVDTSGRPRWLVTVRASCAPVVTLLQRFRAVSSGTYLP
jgi:hypothetical protein